MGWMKELLSQSPWLAALVPATIAVIVSLIVHRLGGVLLRRAARLSVVLKHVVEALHQPAQLVLPLIALQIVWQAAPNDLRFIDTVRHINGLALIGTFTWLVMSAISGVADGVIAKHPSNVADNLHARRIQTQARVLARTAMILVLMAGASFMLMTFPGARQVGASLLASAGVIGIVGGIAARPVFANLIAGLQIALAQPIRIDDVLIVEGEWGRVEEITGTYVVLNIWDERRLIIPLQYFIEKPFQNWTRNNSQMLGSVFVYADFGMPLAPLRAEMERIVRAAPEWDQRVFVLQVTDATERTMQIRILATAESSPKAFDLRCRIREGIIDFMQREYPQFLPQLRVQNATDFRPASRLDAPAPSAGGAGPKMEQAINIQAPPGGDATANVVPPASIVRPAV